MPRDSITFAGRTGGITSVYQRSKMASRDEEISDSIWMFSRELYREELLAWAKPDHATEKVNWARGRAALQVQTIDLEDGFTRVIVSAYFEGFGEPEDKFAMQRASRKLISTGKPL